tara:strand:+ start:74 stop:376 length:303 start_codon:yes stop_codon:yes gene_type:complete
MKYAFTSIGTYDVTFSHEVCFFLVGEGAQTRGYFRLKDDIKFFKSIEIDETIRIEYADDFMGPTTGTVLLTDVPTEVVNIFANYIPRLKSYILESNKQIP